MLILTKVAQADGQFEKALGKKIEWRRFNSGAEVIAALASNSIQIGNLGSTPYAAAVSRKVPLVAFIVSTQINSAEALVVRNGSGINKPEDLKNKTIATPFVSTAHYSLSGALKHWKIASNEINIINLNPAEIIAAWHRGDIDGAFVWAPALGEIKKTGKVLTDAGQTAQWGFPTFEVWVARKDYANQHPEILTKYSQVILNSFADYAQDPQRYTAKSPEVSKIARLVGADPQSVPELLAGCKYPTKNDQLSSNFLNGGMAEATRTTAQFLFEQKRISGVLSDYNQYFSANYVELAKE